MPNTQGFPFRRLSVDHMVHGVSRIWWEYLDSFNDAPPYTTQLQFGHAGNNDATDWVNVGSTAINASYATDDIQREYGKVLDSYYRVTLTTSRGTYVSQPVHCQGQLPEKDWLLAREIERKERLRFSKAGRDGFLFKRMRYGAPCECLDELTGEVTNSDCRKCHGTGFSVGYFAPVPCTCFDLTAEQMNEDQDNQMAGTIGPSKVVARALGYPPILARDIWADKHSDQRWEIGTIKDVAEIRGVPIIQEVTMDLLAFSEVAYQLPVGGEPHDDDPDTDELPTTGNGTIPVTHDWGGDDELAYQTASGIPIIGAVIKAFTQADFDAAAPNMPADNLVVAQSTTTANGRWTYAMDLDPGDYAIVFHKPGAFGPDHVSITVS